jgi:hypothetical protein
MESGRVYISEYEDYFVKIPLNICRKDGMSAKALGLYTWLRSHKSGQYISIQFAINHFKDGRDSIKSAIVELEKLGYLVRKQLRDDANKFQATDYHLLNEPLTGKPLTEIPLTEKPLTGNPQQSKNSIYNKKERIIKEIKGKSSSNVSPDEFLGKKSKITDFKKLSDFGEELTKALPHFEEFFPERFRPTEFTEKRQWLFTIWLIQERRKITPRKLYLLCQEIKADEFWKNNFDSIRKLWKKNKEGIFYIDYFMERFGKNIEKFKF